MNEYEFTSPGMVTFIARFTSLCPACPEWIMPGDECRWDDDYVYVHADCSAVKPPLALARVCPNCNLLLPVSGRCEECES